MTEQKQHKRRYAHRSPRALPRLETICARISRKTRQSLDFLAEHMSISLSEYVARILNSHVSSLDEEDPIQRRKFDRDFHVSANPCDSLIKTYSENTIFLG